jgi:hypothetical protein
MDENQNENKIKYNIRPALFEIDVTNTLGNDYLEMFDDILRFVTIQFGIQIMLCMADPQRFPIFTGEIIILMFYIISGVIFYWLVLKKLIHFT